MNERKQIGWVGNSKKEILELDAITRKHFGFQLNAIQCGETPADFKHMQTIGSGVYEIRVDDENGKNTGRCFYVTKFENTVFILHCFKKLQNKTPKKNIELGQKRYKMLIEELKQEKKVV